MPIMTVGEYILYGRFVDTRGDTIVVDSTLDREAAASMLAPDVEVPAEGRAALVHKHTPCFHRIRHIALQI